MTLDAAASQQAKAAGQQLSILFDGEWRAAVLVELRAWLAMHRAQGHTNFTLEQFRHDAIAQPQSHKSWGSLPSIACREGLIAPMLHGDGSPVMRRAESVKTHAHPVRIWRITPLFIGNAADEETATLIEAKSDEAANQPAADAGVGEGRHSRCEVRV